MKDLKNSKAFLLSLGVKIKEPKVIYHYTGPAGLLGIVLERNIWASDIQYLNDMEEFKYASSKILKKIREKKNLQKFRFIADIVKSINRRNILKENQIYVCSFSEKGNLLSQWRAYAPDFNGYSIGFSFSKLNMLITKQTDTDIDYYLYPCIYDKKKQEEIINKMVKIFLQTLYDIFMPPNFHFEEKKKIFNDFILQYLIVSSILKDESFSEEKEWRLVGVRKSTRQSYKNYYRINKSMLIPYSKFDFSLVNPICEIYIGPSPHVSLAVNSIKNILGQENIKAKIIRSMIPYRNW